MLAQVDVAKGLFEGYEKLGVIFLLMVAVVALIWYLLKLTKEHKTEREGINKDWQGVLKQHHEDMKEIIKNNSEAINNNSNLVSSVKSLLESIDRRLP